MFHLQYSQIYRTRDKFEFRKTFQCLFFYPQEYLKQNLKDYNLVKKVNFLKIWVEIINVHNREKESFPIS